MARLFFSYSHADEGFRDTLEKHLEALKKQGLISTWHDRRINAGDEFAGEISDALEDADVILLLVSADFIASQYCYDIEMKRALERHDAGEARVIPVIVRACDWHGLPFGKLMAAPKDGRPVNNWPDLDEAYLDIAKSVRKAITDVEGVKVATPAPERDLGRPAQNPASTQGGPRSSNLRTRKKFTEADRDEFLNQAFEYMAKFFENSLDELSRRNDAIACKFRRLDANRFTAIIYENGEAVARCKIVLGGMMGRGITFSFNDQASDNSCNELLSVDHDDQDLFMRPMGMALGGTSDGRDSKLTAEGASEFYWSLLMRNLQ